MGDGAGGAPRRHADRGDDAGRPRLHGRSEGRQGEAARDADRRARLGAGARRQERHRLRRHGRAREDRRHRHRRARARALGLGRQARRVAARRGRQAPLRRDLRGGDPVQGRPRRARRGAGRLRRRGGARARALRRRRCTRRSTTSSKGGGAALGRPAPRPRRAARRSPSRPSGSPSSAGSLPRPGQRKAKAALYRIDPDGRMEQMFSIPDGYFTTLAFDDAGRAYVGTGSEGRVYRVAADRTAALAIDVSERQALTLLRAGNGFLVGTGDVGGVYRAAPAAPRQATYLSRVLDGEYRVALGPVPLARHARRRDREPLRQHRQARRRPGPASRRSSARTRPRRAASARSPARPPATSSTARRFGAPEGRLAAVTLAYLPQNQRARITELGLADSGARRAPAAGGLGALAGRHVRAGGGARAPAGAQAALEGGEPRRRRAELPARLPRGERRGLAPARRPRPAHQDRLRLEHRGAARRHLRRQRDRQRRALRAARARARRAPSRRRRSWSTTASPRWSAWPSKYPYVSGRARDDQSPLAAMEYADRRRRLADPVARRRHLRRPGRVVHHQAAARCAPGPHAVTVRAWDSADNVGAAAITIRTPGK